MLKTFFCFCYFPACPLAMSHEQMQNTLTKKLLLKIKIPNNIPVFALKSFADAATAAYIACNSFTV